MTAKGGIFMLRKHRNDGQVLWISQNQIQPNPYQPRKQFDYDALEGLAESIRQNGILQPLTVRRSESFGYEVIAGERRLRAAKILGLEKLPCIIVHFSDETTALSTLLENIQRKDLDFFEESEAIVQMMSMYHMTEDELAKRLGKASSCITEKLKLLRLPEDIRLEILETGLSEYHARALLRLETAEQIRTAMSEITQNHYNGAQTDKLIERLLGTEPPPKKPPLILFKDVQLFVNTINHAIDTMQRSGIAADSVQTETEDYIQYVVRIPKKKGAVIRSDTSGT